MRILAAVFTLAFPLINLKAQILTLYIPMDDSRFVDSSQPFCELTGDRDDKLLFEFITRGSHLERQYMIISKDSPINVYNMGNKA
jgi:hypothetical protein